MTLFILAGLPTQNIRARFFRQYSMPKIILYKINSFVELYSWKKGHQSKEFHMFCPFSSCPILHSIRHLTILCRTLFHGTSFFHVLHKVDDRFEWKNFYFYNIPYKLIDNQIYSKLQNNNLIFIWSNEKYIIQFPSPGLLLPAIKCNPFSLAHLMPASAM